ncbi:YbaN family protein [Zavarzinia sp. CC-PAN008]|uniref:YbaN family protein n=1 Tax=Zavarzinia sp. CC-PAN008 TaxID=3243332 RepID=UPI003F7448C9
MIRLAWIGLGWTSVALGFAGIFLPVLPTTPFLLLAAFAFARGSPRIERWLLAHPRLGPPIRDWRQHGAIPRRAKRIAIAAMVVAFAVSLALGLPAWILAVQGAALLGAGAFILTRPDGPGA